MNIPAILNDFLHLFFPKLCILCKVPLTGNENQLCIQCLCDLPHTGFHHQESNPVIQLFAGKVAIEKATSLFYYEKGGKVQQLIHAFKYHGNRELAFLLGKQIALNLQSDTTFKNTDILIPVPLHKKRKRQRGYNQAECICHGISSVWGIPVGTDLLVRTSVTGTQTRKGIYDRWLNVNEVFRLKNQPVLAGKHILLVDDVITSGSTLSACAEVFTDISGIRISILSLAVA